MAKDAVARILFGAGVFRSKREASSMRNAFMHFYRNSCWAIAGCSSTLLHVAEVCSALGVLGVRGCDSSLRLRGMGMVFSGSCTFERKRGWKTL